MKKVLVFGTFDHFHKGHEFFLKEAKKQGDMLIVVVARDKTVKYVKGIVSTDNEKKRVVSIENFGVTDKVILGSETDYYSILSEIKPDVICLGYDQHHFVGNLDEELESRGLNKTKIIRISAHEADKYKSSIIRKDK